MPGLAASAAASFGNMMLIAEHLAAMDAFHGDEITSGGVGAQPATWTVEHRFALLTEKQLRRGTRGSTAQPEKPITDHLDIHNQDP